MPEFWQSVFAQMPAVAILLFALHTVYEDMKAERKEAKAERLELIRQLYKIRVSLGDDPTDIDRPLGLDKEIAKIKKS
jgi:hypothetical protein